MINTPVLDDKNYRQLLAEALAMIPSLTDEWTDFNPQDTGIMLLELLAGMTEMQNFYLDQVGDRFYRQLLVPVTGAKPDETHDELLHNFALEQNRLSRAVTAEDYRGILLDQLKPDFKLDDVRVEISGKLTRIYVWRRDCPLSADELDALKLCLDGYRLLTARIYVEQPETWTGGESDGT